MTKQKKLPNRQSMSLQGYDYSNPGFYFITICTNQKECLFGDVINGEMHMNECGVVASDYLKQIDTRYPNTIFMNILLCLIIFMLSLKLLIQSPL